MKRSLKEIAENLKNEVELYRRLSRDERIPKISKVFLGAAVLYLLSPIDLIPDVIPVLGHLDDLIIIPLLLYLSLKFIPDDVIEEVRREIQSRAEPPSR